MAQVLIIDDTQIVRSVIRRLLESQGHSVMEASSGLEGTRLHRNHPADLVITDILMEEGDGLEVIQSLRQDNPDLKIIAITGSGNDGVIDYLRVAKIMGATSTLRKPFANEEFLAAIETCLAN